MDSSVTGYPGIEPRAWWSPTRGYFLLRWSRQTGSDAIDMWIVSWEDGAVAVELPPDAAEIGAFPTKWAYDQTCQALHRHRERADNLAGRLEALRLKVISALRLRAGLPIEAAVDAALHRALVVPSSSPEQRQSWNQAYTRVSQLAGLRADEGEVSTWALVQRALTRAVNDADLHREVTELAKTLGIGLSAQERSPEWLKS